MAWHRAWPWLCWAKDPRGQGERGAWLEVGKESEHQPTASRAGVSAGKSMRQRGELNQSGTN